MHRGRALVFASIIINKRVRRMHICYVTPKSTPLKQSNQLLVSIVTATEHNLCSVVVAVAVVISLSM